MTQNMTRRMTGEVRRVRASLTPSGGFMCVTHGEGGNGTPVIILRSCKQAASNGRTPAINRSELVQMLYGTLR